MKLFLSPWHLPVEPRKTHLNCLLAVATTEFWLTTGSFTCLLLLYCDSVRIIVSFSPESEIAFHGHHFTIPKHQRSISHGWTLGRGRKHFNYIVFSFLALLQFNLALWFVFQSSNTSLRQMPPCTYHSVLELFVVFRQNTFVQAQLVVLAAPSVASILWN